MKLLGGVSWSSALFLLGHLLCLTDSHTEDLFSCRNLSDAHYQYLKPPGHSVTLTCPKNCSSGETRWYHSYLKKTTAAAGGGLDLLAWSGSSHEAAVRETPSQGSVGYFCCVCEEEEDAARDGCCWGVAYQPVVNMTITAGQAWTGEDEIVAVAGTNLSLRCEARGYPNISLTISPPSGGLNNTLPVSSQCREVVKSWYSSVVVCNWTTANEIQQTSLFWCNATILLDSADNKIVPYNKTASQQLSICKVPSLVRLYHSSPLEESSLELKCEIDCCRVSLCSVSWYFEGEEIDTRDKRYRISSSDDGLVHVLTVVNQGMRESGKYFCVLRSPLRSTPDKMTQTITPPGGAKPTPMKPLPGPDRDEEAEARTTASLTVVFAAMIVATVTAIVVMTVAIIIQRTRTAKQSGGVGEQEDKYRDEAQLIRYSEPDDVERDGVRHRLSEQNTLDSDASDEQ